MKINSEHIPLENIKRKINVFTLIFSSLILFDIILGVQVSKEEIQHKVYLKQRTGTIRSSGTKSVFGIVTNKQEYPLRKAPLYNDSKEGDKILIHKSKLLDQVTKIEFKNIEYTDSAYSLYAFYYLFPFICITSSLCAYFLDKFRSPYFDFFLILSSIMTVYLVLSIFTNSKI